MKANPWPFKKVSRTTNMAFLLVTGLLTAWCGVFAAVGLRAENQLPIPAGPKDRVVNVLGSKMRYRDIGGEGQPIIFVHGHNLSINDWEPVLDALPGRHLVAVDLIGYAGSDRPALPYDLETHRRYIVAFMDAIGVGKGFLVGHSIGGTIAAWAAARSSERVLGSVIIAPGGVPGSTIYKWPISLIVHPGVANRVVFQMVSSPPFRKIFPFRTAAQAIGIWSSFSQEYVEALADIHQPTMLIWSPGDRRTLMTSKGVYEERIGNLRFEEVPPAAGHMVPMAYPGGTASLIADFVDSVEEPTGASLVPRSKGSLGSATH